MNPAQLLNPKAFAKEKAKAAKRTPNYGMCFILTFEIHFTRHVLFTFFQSCEI